MRMAGGQRPGGRPSSGGIASCLSGCAYLAKQRWAHENRKNIPGCRDTACLGLAPDTKHCHEPDDGAAAARDRGRGGVGSVGEKGFITLIKVGSISTGASQLYVGRGIVPPGTETPAHLPEVDEEILYVLEGEITLTLDDEVHTVGDRKSTRLNSSH